MDTGVGLLLLLFFLFDFNIDIVSGVDRQFVRQRLPEHFLRALVSRPEAGIISVNSKLRRTFTQSGRDKHPERQGGNNVGRQTHDNMDAVLP